MIAKSKSFAKTISNWPKRDKRVRSVIVKSVQVYVGSRILQQRVIVFFFQKLRIIALQMPFRSTDLSGIRDLCQRKNIVWLEGW